MRGNISSSSRAILCPRSCSGEGDGRGRMDPLRGGGDKTVICCGERSGGGEGSGNESSDSTGGPPSPSSPDSASPNAVVGGTVAMGVSPSRWRKSESGPMCVMGVAGMDVGISSMSRLGCTTVVIVGGCGGVERPEGALRMRRRCLSDVVRGMVGSGA